MLPALAESLREGKPFALSSTGAQNWDYLYAADAADALLALVERGRTGEIYNITHGDYRPLHDFIAEAQRTIAPNAAVSYGEGTGNFSLQASVDKLRRDTGWQPTTGFIEGLCRGYLL